MNYGLPTSVEINGKEFAIRSDFRAILDIFTALNDPELQETEKQQVILEIFYVNFESLELQDLEEAFRQWALFVNMGDAEAGKGQPKLMDWEQDFFPLISAVNNVAGQEVRALEYLHWWTFLGYYNEIGGDCYFAQIVQIRDKLKRGKRLESYERDFYRRNREKIDFKQRYTDAEEQTLDMWLKGAKNG